MTTNRDLAERIVMKYACPNFKVATEKTDVLETIEKALNDKDAETEKLKADNVVKHQALEKAARELNEIRARDGVPYTHLGYQAGVSEEYFSSVVDECFAAIGHNSGKPLLDQHAAEMAVLAEALESFAHTNPHVFDDGKPDDNPITYHRTYGDARRVNKALENLPQAAKEYEQKIRADERERILSKKCELYTAGGLRVWAVKVEALQEEVQ